MCEFGNDNSVLSKLMIVEGVVTLHGWQRQSVSERTAWWYCKVKHKIGDGKV